MKTWRSPGLWIIVVVILAVGLWPVAVNDPTAREVVYTILLSVVLAGSLNIILGYTGYISFGHVVFFGLGGYITLYLMNTLQASLWLALIGAGLAAALLAFLLGKAILRLRGAFFALATIGVNEAMRAFMNNFTPLGGSTGISLNFSVYNSYGGALHALWLDYGILVVLALGVILLNYAIKTSKFGLGLITIREDEDAAEGLGVVTPDAKTWAYVLSAVLPGVVGGLYYFKNINIEPNSAFNLEFSIELLVMVMLGGMGTVLGPILGAVGYQSLRGALLTSPIFKDIQLSVAGLILLIIILFIPAGAIGWLRRRFLVIRNYLP